MSVPQFVMNCFAPLITHLPLRDLARAPHFFRKRQTEKAKLPHLAHDVVAESMIPIELPRRRRDDLPREVATRVSNRLLFRSQCKIHCNNPCMTTRKRCTLPRASRT